LNLPKTNTTGVKSRTTERSNAKTRTKIHQRKLTKRNFKRQARAFTKLRKREANYRETNSNELYPPGTALEIEKNNGQEKQSKPEKKSFQGGNARLG